ncbi:MAG: SH3 domain-containing protein [Caldithrix sp.]|nr:SH3 domain-containing protein [Caldithrix sp.]
MQKFLFISIVLFMAACTTQKTMQQKPQTAIPEKPQAVMAYVIKETVNVRDRGSVQGQIVDQLSDGAKVRIIKNKNGWYYVQYQQQKGWIRSDLVGPGNMSLTRMAAAFNDSTMRAFNANLYFDQTNPYRIVYLVFPQNMYNDEALISERARTIGKAYQEKVYSGSVEIRIMDSDQTTLYKKINLRAIGPETLPSPLILHGRLISLKQVSFTITAKIAAPDSLSQTQLLRTAREISVTYPLPFTKVEVYINTDTPQGIKQLKHLSRNPMNPDLCLLYFIEDASGPRHQFDYCSDKSSKAAFMAD